MEALSLALNQVNERIISVCAESRKPQPQLIAVSKTKPAAMIQCLYELGQKDFGENYLQEAQEKAETLKGLDIRWHFIGPLQSNKARAVANQFTWVHTVDRLKLAQKLSHYRAESGLDDLQVLIQVNIDGESTKSGVAAADVLPLAQAINRLPKITLRGLMAIPAPKQGLEEQRKPFKRVFSLFNELKKALPETPVDTLSMGMSGDLEAAILEGSTMVRIGTDLFGSRNTKTQHPHTTSKISELSKFFMQSKISFIGAGNMASAIIAGLIQAKHSPDNIVATAPGQTNLERLQAQYGIKISHDNFDALSADVIILATKPQIMESVLRPLAGKIPSGALIVSLAAGITCNNLQQWLTNGSQQSLALVRCMPNTPLQVGVGASGLFATPDVSDQQKQRISEVLSCAGKNFWLEEESQIDSLTAVSGSGPAYFFQFMEAMIAAAEAQGMDAQMALELTLQTALGAATLASQSGIPPKELKARVMSPGGTTERAIHHFEKAGINEIVTGAMLACRDRAVEMNKAFTDSSQVDHT